MAHAVYRWIRQGDYALAPTLPAEDLADLHPRSSQLYVQLRKYAADPTLNQPTVHFLRDGILRAHTKTIQAAYQDLEARGLVRRAAVHGRWLVLVNPLPSEQTVHEPLSVADLTDPVAEPLTIDQAGGASSPVDYYSHRAHIELLRSSIRDPMFVISGATDMSGRMTPEARERLAAYHTREGDVGSGDPHERSEPSPVWGVIGGGSPQPTETARERAERLRAAMPRTGSGIKKVRNRKRGPRPTPVNPDVEIVIGLYRAAYRAKFGCSPEEAHPHVWGSKNGRGIDKKNIERLTQHYTIPALLGGLDLFLNVFNSTDFHQIKNWGHTLRAFYNLWPTLIERYQRDIQHLANTRYAEYARPDEVLGGGE